MIININIILAITNNGNIEARIRIQLQRSANGIRYPIRIISESTAAKPCQE